MGKKKGGHGKETRMLRWTAGGTCDSHSGYHLLLTPGASAILSRVAGNPAVCSWFSSLQADAQGEQTPFPFARGGRCLIMHHASDFPLEGWRQGLNSALPQTSRDTGSWKASVIALPPPCMRTHPRACSLHPAPPTLTDNGCRPQSNPTQYHHPETGMERVRKTGGGWRGAALHRIAPGTLTKPVFKYSVHKYTPPLY